jgi:hypothetical protein
MGVEQHHVMIVTVGDHSRAEINDAHRFARLLGMLVSPVTQSPTNARLHFVVFPDGSYDGWEESIDGDAQRTALCQWLREHVEPSRFRWLEVTYGEHGASIVDSSHGTEPT